MEEKIQEELVLVNQKLDIIIELLKNNQRTTDKMSDHIDFVESVYTVVRSPLNSMIKYMKGAEPLPLTPTPEGGAIDIQ